MLLEDIVVVFSTSY